MSANENIEKLYSPKQWSKRFSPEAVIEDFLKRCSEGSDHARQAIPCDLDISYSTSGSKNQKLNIYGTDLPKSSPILVVIHGGYWYMCSKDLYGFLGEGFHGKGIVTVVVGYDLCPQVTLEDISKQIHTAATFIIKMAEERESKGVYFTGHSAGGQLISMLLCSDWLESLHGSSQLVKGFLPLAAVFDVLPLIHTSHNEHVRLNREMALKMSPLYHIPKQQPKFSGIKILSIVGEYDSPAYIEKTKAFTKAMEEKGWSCSYISVDGVDHFDLVLKLGEPDYVLTQIFVDFMNA